MKLLVATSNAHKLDEIRGAFAAAGGAAARQVHLVSLADAGLDVPEPVEDRASFEGNAELKARYYAQASGLLTLADDSGLEVDALGGEPGVYSARYAGVVGGREVVDPANNERLLRELGDTPAAQRTARFVCAMALAFDEREPGRVCMLDEIDEQTAGGILAVVRGTVEGRILGPGDPGFTGDPTTDRRGRGTHGFGYDPIFLLPARGLTAAELTPDEKNAISHRGCASRRMWERLGALVGEVR